MHCLRFLLRRWWLGPRNGRVQLKVTLIVSMCILSTMMSCKWKYLLDVFQLLYDAILACRDAWSAFGQLQNIARFEYSLALYLHLS